MRYSRKRKKERNTLIRFRLISKSVFPIREAERYSTNERSPGGNQNSTSSMNCSHSSTSIRILGSSKDLLKEKLDEEGTGLINLYPKHWTLVFYIDIVVPLIHNPGSEIIRSGRFDLPKYVSYLH